MNAGRDVERLIADWFVEEAVLRAPDRILEQAGRVVDRTKQRRLGVAWRNTFMSAPFRVAAAAVLGVLVLGGALILIKPWSSNVGEPSPSPSVPAGPVGDLTNTFVSNRHGYTIQIPTDWTITQATRAWQPGAVVSWGDPALDVFQGQRERLVVAAQDLATGQSPNDWFELYCRLDGAAGIPCEDFESTWPKVAVGNQSGYIDHVGADAPRGTILPGGPMFDAVIVIDGRGYKFTLDGDVTRADFERLLATVSVPPVSLVDNLTKTFASPLYDYSIRLDPSWAAAAATVPEGEPTSGGESSSDTFAVTGTDTTIGVTASRLNGQTFDAWLVDTHEAALNNVPEGCDGGDPSTWPSVPVGNLTGKVMQLCNAAEVEVERAQRAYSFFWGNDTFNASQHLDQSEFDEVLKTVVFP